MDGQPMTRTLSAVSEVVELLTRHDLATIVAFDGQVDVIQELGPVTNKLEIHQKVQQLYARGGTNLSAGWLKALQILSEKTDEECFKRVILLTDGQVGAGVQELEKLGTIASTFLQKGISTSTFGLGRGFNENVLKLIAEKGNGNFYYIEGPEDVSSAFQFEFGELNAIVGQNLEVQISCGKGIEILETLGHGSAKSSANTCTVSLGDVSEGLEKNLVLRLRVPREIAHGSQRLFEFSTSYQKASGDYATVRSTSEFATEFRSGDVRRYLDHEVLDDVMIERTARLKIQVYQDVQAREVGKALTMLNERINLLGERVLTTDVVKKEELEAEIAALETIKQAIEEKSADQGKVIQQQVEDFQKKKGSYLKTRAERKYILNSVLAAQAQDEFQELMKHLGDKLNDLGQEGEFRQNCLICMQELVANALEHGCQQVQKGEVQVRGIFRKGSAMITVSDPGAGFDWEEKVKTARANIELAEKARNDQSGTPQQTAQSLKGTSTRGRGIQLLLTLADEVTYTCAGSEVMVKLSNKVSEGVISFDNTTVSSSSPFASSFSVKVRNHVINQTPMVELEPSECVSTFVCQQAKQAVKQVMAKGAVHLILNLKNVPFTDSAGLGFYCGALKHCVEAGGSLSLIVACDNMKRVFNMIQILQWIPCFATLDDLRSSLENPDAGKLSA